MKKKSMFLVRSLKMDYTQREWKTDKKNIVWVKGIVINSLIAKLTSADSFKISVGCVILGSKCLQTNIYGKHWFQKYSKIICKINIINILFWDGKRVIGLRRKLILKLYELKIIHKTLFVLFGGEKVFMFYCCCVLTIILEK